MTQIIFTLLVTGITLGQNYKVVRSMISAGGTSATSTSYTSNSSTGQPDIGTANSPSYQSHTGFWDFYASQQEQGQTFSFNFAGGWNMISVPLTMNDYQKMLLYPTSASSAFAYDGGYQTEDTLTNGIGYWLKFDTPQWVSLSGVQRTLDTLTLKDKWNIIGSISSNVSISNVTQIPSGIVTSSFFGYDDGYYQAETIEPGKAYWVKTNGGGLLVMSSSVALLASLTGEQEKETAQTPNSIIVEPQSAIAKAKARKQQLLFGHASVLSQDMSMYDLPPVPPVGSADVRFASNRFAELVPDELNTPKEFPLKVQSNGSPMKLSWTISEEKNVHYYLIEKTGKKITAKHRLSGSTSVIINPSEDKTYALVAEQIPTEFALLQNYPNPFNPVTVISYKLKVKSAVNLKVFNLLGQEVAMLVNDMQDEGNKSVEFNAVNLASGTYFYQLTATEEGIGKVFRDVKKLIMLK